MKVGLMVGEGSGAAPELKGVIERGQMAEKFGLDTAWIANIALDAMTASTALGGVTDRIEIGTAVVPIPTRHPVALSQQAASTQLACEGRFTLGIGLAHQFIVEGLWGLSYKKPAEQMRTCLEILEPVLRGEKVSLENERYSVNHLSIPEGGNTPLLIAALGPIMLELAGRLSDGTITWATGIKTLENHIVPTINAGADAIGRPAPRVVAGFPVVLTKNLEKAREMSAEIFAMYAQIPSYRAMLDREGVDGIGELALVGDESTLREEIARLESVGVTDLCAFPLETEAGEAERTVQFLGSL